MVKKIWGKNHISNWYHAGLGTIGWLASWKVYDILGLALSINKWIISPKWLGVISVLICALIWEKLRSSETSPFDYKDVVYSVAFCLAFAIILSLFGV